MPIGVPQGSILGPLLFIIYMNDTHKSSTFFDFILYADDTTLFNPLGDTCPVNVVNSELNKIFNWLCANKLSINVTKSKYIIFHSQKKNIKNKVPQIILNETPVERVVNFDFLGIFLDEHMTWTSHINKIANKIAKSIGILNKLKQYLPSYIFRKLYNSVILPHINYGILVWGFGASRINKLQKRSIRIINNQKYNAHAEPLFKLFNLLKVEDIFKLNCLKFYFKYCRQQVPLYFLKWKFTSNSDIHLYNTRQKDSLTYVRTKTKFAEKCIHFEIPKLINSTDTLILQKNYTHSFRSFCIKNSYINAYEYECKIENCYVCGN